MKFDNAAQTCVVDWELHLLSPSDAASVLQLLERADGGLGLLGNEINLTRIEDALETARADGVGLGAYDSAGLVGVLHAVRLPSAQFEHMLSDLTVSIDPRAQGTGVQRSLLESLLHNAPLMKPRIERIELVVRESLTDTIRLYGDLGFRQEGRFENRFCVGEGKYEAGLPMALLLEQSSNQ